LGWTTGAEWRLNFLEYLVRREKAEEGRRSPRRWRVFRQRPNRAKRLGVRQSSGALEGGWWPSAKTSPANLDLLLQFQGFRGQ